MQSEEIPASELVRRLLTILADELDRNPALAEKVIAALPQSIKRPESSKRLPPSFNPREYNPVNILRAHGESMLRGKLTQLNNREKLRAVAKASNLTLAASASKAKASVTDIVEAIVKAAVDYDRQRAAATDS